MNRRQFIALSALGLGASLTSRLTAAQPPFRIRTITAGIAPRGAEDLSELDAATTFLERAKACFEPDYTGGKGSDPFRLYSIRTRSGAPRS